MMASAVRQQVEAKVQQAIATSSMWAPGEMVVVAVSGGADSLCLLQALQALQPRHGGHLHVAHLDHGLRGAASAAEAAQVAALARQWGLPMTVESADVPALRERESLSLEEAARVVRYRFLVRVAAEVGAAAIVLGHTADDQAETVLMHLVRGAGLGGLRGMRTVSPLAPWMSAGLALARPLRLVRPLLGVTRVETADYCATCGLTPAQDPWNQECRFLRVRLRQEVIPLLETINPRFREALLRLAQQAAWQEEDLQTMLAGYWPALAAEGDGVIRLALANWWKIPWTLRLLALRRAVERVRGHLEGLSAEAVMAAGRLDSAAVGSEVALVETLLARREQHSLAVGWRAALGTPCRWPDLGQKPLPLVVPGRTDLPGGHALLAEEQPPTGTPWTEAGPWEAWLDADRCGQRLWLRQRRPGDRFQPLGMTGQKKLQDFFVDEKVPRQERDGVPLVVSPHGIVWVVAYRPDERFRVHPGTRRVLHLRWIVDQAGAGYPE
jgi:tRNA(Ile)-lysidine synthetase-like protein